MEKLAVVVFVDAIFYWVRRRPDVYAYEVSQKPEKVHITLFESSSHDLSDGKMKDCGL